MCSGDVRPPARVNGCHRPVLNDRYMAATAGQGHITQSILVPIPQIEPIIARTRFVREHKTEN
jgi:hypothetical protein